MKIPDLVKFKPTARNQMTIQRNGGKVVPLTMNDKPVSGGDLVAGELYEIDIHTGETKPVK